MKQQDSKKFLYWFFDLFPNIIFNGIISHMLNTFGIGLNKTYNKIKKETDYDV